MRDGGRIAPADGGVDVGGISHRRTAHEIARLDLFLNPQRRTLGGEDARSDLDAPPENLLGRLRRRELAARVEQRVRDLRGLAVPAVEAGLLQRDRKLVAERREQPLAVLVQLLHVDDDAALCTVARVDRNRRRRRRSGRRRARRIRHRARSRRAAVSNTRVAAWTASVWISSTECARESSSAKASSAFAPSASRRCCS